MPNHFWIVDPARGHAQQSSAEYVDAVVAHLGLLPPDLRPRVLYVHTIGVGGAVYDKLADAVAARHTDVQVRPFNLAAAEPFAELLAQLLPPHATRRLVWQRIAPDVPRETSPPPADVPAPDAHGPVQPAEEAETGTAPPDTEANVPALTVYEAQVIAARSSGVDPDRRMLYCTHMPDHPDHQAHTGFKTEGEPCDTAINLCPIVRCPGRMLPKLECDTCGHVYDPEQHIGDEPGARCTEGTWDGPEPRRCPGHLRVYVPRPTNLKPKT